MSPFIDLDQNYDLQYQQFIMFIARARFIYMYYEYFVILSIM